MKCSCVPPVIVSHTSKMHQLKIHKRCVFPSGTCWYQWTTRCQGQILAAFSLAFSVKMCNLIVKLVLKLFFRETLVNQQRGGRMGDLEFLESPVFLGKRSELCKTGPTGPSLCTFFNSFIKNLVIFFAYRYI